MGSHLSRNDMNTPGCINSTSLTNNNNVSNESIQSDMYIKDQFRLDFLDCHCCCDTTKKITNCDFQGMNILKDLHEMVVTPEYKLNCRCSCGDDNDKKPIKFGLTGSPNAQLTFD